MLNDIRNFLRPDPTYKAIFNAEEQQFQIVINNIEDLKHQFNVDTATWGLAIYERELNIKTDLSKSFDERRSVIKAKLRGSGKVDATLIKIVAIAYTNGEVDVAFNNAIIVRFLNVFGSVSNFNDFKNSIEEIVPAHLGLRYVQVYTTYEELKAKTYGQLAGFKNYQIRTLYYYENANTTYNQLSNKTYEQMKESLNVFTMIGCTT